MRRRPERLDEGRARRLLSELGDAVRAPADEELARAARSAAANERAVQASGRPRRRGWIRVAVVAAGLGIGLGFGFGAWLTPTAPATRPFVGFGFLPAKGWTVVQSGTDGATGAATAIAANVPLDPADRLGLVPSATVSSLPSRGVLIFTRFTTRGDPHQDADFPVRELPLRLDDAEPAGPAEYRLRAGVNGFNADVRVFFGAGTPSADARAAADRQLSRLLVAAERVTIFARPAVVDARGQATLFGTAEGARADEIVTVQARQCGAVPSVFANVVTARTRAGGGWSTPFSPPVASTLRAVWRNETSAQITIRPRADVRLVQRPSARARYGVAVVAKVQFWRRSVLVQRFDRRLGTWTTVKRVTLTQTGAAPGSAYIWSTADFRLSVPRGTLLRASFPASQARPCYLAGVSPAIRA